MKIAIHSNESVFNHSTSWNKPWEDYCKRNNITYEKVDCYRYDILERLKDFDCLLWHFSQYSLQDMLFARSILYSAKEMGLRIFPDFNTGWHFDDKLAESYLLQAVGAPAPEFRAFYTLQDALKWMNESSEYPLVAKLRCGSGSQNVKLLHTKKEAAGYAKKMFGKGIDSAPSLLYKGTSQLRSAKNWKTVKARMKRIPDFLESLSKAKKLPMERGYVYLQEFIPNEGFDLKIVVVGDKLSFIARNIRKGEFRASGSGSFSFDKSLVSRDIIDSAFQVSDRLGFQCMGYDYVVDTRSGKGKIIEISYGFSHTTLLMAEGYWDRGAVWHDEPLNAPEDILERLINQN